MLLEKVYYYVKAVLGFTPRDSLKNNVLQEYIALDYNKVLEVLFYDRF